MMFVWLVSFVSAFIVSALGSIPVGVINMTVIQIAVQSRWAQTYYFIAIASLAEILHVYVAILLLGFINVYPKISLYFSYASIGFIIILGLYNVLQSNHNKSIKPISSGLKAWIINIFNPFSIPFWLFFTTYLLQEKWLPVHFSEFAFSVGASLGAAFTLLLYALSGKWITSKHILDKVNMDRIIGIIMLTLGLIKMINLIRG